MDSKQPYPRLKSAVLPAVTYDITEACRRVAERLDSGELIPTGPNHHPGTTDATLNEYAAGLAPTPVKAL